MDAATQLLSGKLGELPFDLIDPRSRRWREVHLVVRPPRQPGFAHGGLMRRVIVHDNVNVEAVRDAGVDLLEKIQKLGRPVALVAFADHEAGSDVEGCKQRRCAVADISMGPPLGNARHHWQNWLLAIKSLYLALLVDAQRQRPIGRR
jgi:hypothetical protein